MAARVESADLELAGIWFAQADETLDRGGFARSVRPQQSENFAGLNGKTDAADGFDAVVALAQIADDHFRGHSAIDERREIGIRQTWNKTIPAGGNPAGIKNW